MVNVDVILISYNQEQYIGQAIESILSQKLSDDISVRIIIADDCSTDKTLDIIKSYESKSPFQFVYTNFGVNLGLQENYRRTFELCSGDYVAILEGDDWWHSEFHIKQHIDILEKNKKYSMSINQIRFYHQNTSEYTIEKWIYPKTEWKISFKQQVCCGNQLGNLSACVFRNSLISKLTKEFYQINFADWELGIFMTQYGDIVKIKSSTSTYRINSQGQWSKLDKIERQKSMLKTLDDMNMITKGKYQDIFHKGKLNIINDNYDSPYISWKTKIKLFLGIIK